MASLTMDERKFSFDYCENLKDYYVQIFELPHNSTIRLIELKLAELEAQTKLLSSTLVPPQQLAVELKEKQERLAELSEKVMKARQESMEGERDMLTYKGELEFIRSKLKQLDINKLDQCKKVNSLLKSKLKLKTGQLHGLNRELEEFDGIEPTNQALEKKIEELRKRRQSLEITFVDSP